MPKWVRFLFSALEHWTRYKIDTWSILNTCRIYVISSTLNHGYKPNPYQNTLIKSSILFLIYRRFHPKSSIWRWRNFCQLGLMTPTQKENNLQNSTFLSVPIKQPKVQPKLCMKIFHVAHSKSTTKNWKTNISLSLSPAKSNFFCFNSQTP